MNNTNNQNNKKKKKGLVIVLVIILALLLIGVAAFTVTNVVGKNAMHDYDDMTVTPSDSENIGDVENNGKTIEYKGETYNFNEDVTTLILMGIDETDYEFDKEKAGPNGYIDAIYLAVIDTKEENVTIVSVPRNSMVDVDVYDKDDNLLETRNEQIFLSYSYNNKKEDAISNVITSLQRLFSGIKFDTYYAINQDAVETLNDSIGGVTLAPQVQFYSVNENRYIEPGSEFTLKGHDAVMYIRSKEWGLDENESEIDLKSNRVTRQVQYMQEFSKQTWSSFKADPTIVEEMYNTIKDNTTTNIDVSKFTYLATTAVAGLDSYADIKYDVVPGELTEGEYYHKYNVDEEKLMELIVNLYYEKAE